MIFFFISSEFCHAGILIASLSNMLIAKSNLKLMALAIISPPSASSLRVVLVVRALCPGDTWLTPRCYSNICLLVFFK